ncbi:hypothetical protein Fmac_016566 [Flemingia macrophylla]|uniref:Pectinesterase inhibitor domain-containing protein n=1 Tax=Flemingia macrophylla TaxID=520843 RepID=A0ABD1MHQ9_9FABA
MFPFSDASNKVVDVKTICAMTNNTSFCSNLLNSRPGGAAGADLHTLMQYTVDVIYGNVTDTIELINMLIANCNNQDVSAKYHFGLCLRALICAKSDIEYNRNQLQFKNYDRLSVGFALVDTDLQTQTCSVFPPHYNDSSVLPKYVEGVTQVNQIIGTIFSLLRSG